MRRRFIFALILAILPFAVLAAGQAAWRLVRAESQAREDLVEATRASSALETNIIARAEAVLRTLRNLPDVRAGGADCNQVLAGALIGTPYAGIARLDAMGRIVCSSSPITDDPDRSSMAWWKQLQARDGFIISEQHRGAVPNQQIITAALPMTRADGARDGALALGIPADFLSQSIRQRRLADDTVAALIDASGAIIAASNLDAARAIVGAGSPTESDELREVTDSSGETWRYAIAAVHEEDLFIAFARRRDALLGWNYVDFAANILLPVMMAVFAFVAIWYAADRFVLRWIFYLQRIARAYGGGHLALRPDTTDAPLEIKQLADAMGDMADNLRTRDSSLRHALEQRTLMSREIHHRVKNNLQIVASLMQIESRRIAEPSAREALLLTHTRINAIALVHRILEEIDVRTVVNLRTLFTELARMVSDAFGGEVGSDPIAVDAPDELIETDAAVPLALYLVEQSAEMYARASTARRSRIALAIHVAHANGTYRVSLSSHGEEGGDDKPKGPNFTAAYVRQLEGRLSRTCEGGRTEITLQFPDRWAIKV